MIKNSSTMLVAILHAYGPPETVGLEHIAIPTPAPDEVLVKVKAATVNRTDCGFRSGEPKLARLIMGWPKPKFQVLGCEFAGDISAIGADVTNFSVGDRVFGYSEDDFGFGGHAEYKCMNVAGMIAKIPKGISYEAAAPACEGGHYAIGYLDACKVAKGTRLLINGATGAIGSAALQLAKARGAQITAVCGTNHLDLISKMGVDQVVDYQVADFTQILAGEEFDVIFDAVGKSTFKQCQTLLKPDGIYTSSELGPMAQNPILALWTSAFGKQKVRFPLPKIRQRYINHLKNEMSAGRYNPLVDRSFAFEDIVEAYHYVETGQKVGNVVLSTPK